MNKAFLIILIVIALGGFILGFVFKFTGIDDQSVIFWIAIFILIAGIIFHKNFLKN